MVGRNGNREPETDRVINVSYRNLKSKSITIHTRVYICISSFRIRKGDFIMTIDAYGPGISII